MYPGGPAAEYSDFTQNMGKYGQCSNAGLKIVLKSAWKF